MFKEMYEKVFEKKLFETSVEAPTKAPPKRTPVQPKPKRKPDNPVVPAPGKKPKPKAKVDDASEDDVKKFLAKRYESRILKKKEITEQEYIHPDKKEWIESGGDELVKEMMPTLSDEEQNYLKVIMSENYNRLIRRLERALNIDSENENIPRLLNLGLRNFEDILELESDHAEMLETMALESLFDLDEFTMVKKAYEDGHLKFDIKLVKPGDMSLNMNNLDDKVTDAPDEGLSQDEQMNLELAKNFGADGDEEALIKGLKIKRRFANILIQGGSALKIDLFHLLSDKLKEIDDTLVNKYAMFMSCADILYWLVPQLGQGGAIGKSEVTPEDFEEQSIYTIKARTAIFPLLIHETAKGIYEWLSLSTASNLVSDVDTEPDTDMMMGPEVFRIFSSYLDTSEQYLLPLVKKKMLEEVSSDDIKHIIAQNSRGMDIMKSIIDSAREDWDDFISSEEYEDEDTYDWE